MFWHRKVFFHEDDYCQQQLLPATALPYVRSELLKIDEHSKKHSSSGVIGWTEMYLRADCADEIDVLQIKIEELDKRISAYFPPFDRVYTGYSSYRERCKDVLAWGLSDACALFADGTKSDVTAHLWVNNFDDDPNAIRRLAQAMGAFGEQYPLIYVDWTWGTLVELVNVRELEKFLTKKNQEIFKRLK